MIFDHIRHGAHYNSMHPLFEKCFRFLLDPASAQLEEGRYDIDGDNAFALVQAYHTKPESEGKWEAHRRYIDIQYMLEGTEIMGITPLEHVSVSQAYSEENDYALFEGTGEKVTVPAGFFTVFYPHDVHMPGLLVNESQPVRKIVIKVRL